MVLCELLFQAAFTAIFVCVGYPVGFFSIFILSISEIEPGPIWELGNIDFYRDKGMKWWHTTYFENGKRYLPAESVAVVGWLIIAAIFGLARLIFSLTGSPT